MYDCIQSVDIDKTWSGINLKSIQDTSRMVREKQFSLL